MIMTGKYSDTIKHLLLAATVFLGLGLSYLSWLKVSAIGSVLFMNYELAHDTAGMIEQINAVLLLLAVSALLFHKTRIWAAGFIFLFCAVLVWADIDQGGYPYSDYGFFATAMRLAAPLAFLVFVSAYLKKVYPRFTFSFMKWMLITATCFTFIMHGLEAIWAHPWFVDMTIVMADKLIGWRMSQSVAEQMLLAVGIIDIVSAIALIVFRSKTAALWMAFWGFFTCFLRLVNYGAGAIPDALIRLPHGILPIVLYFIFRSEKKVAISHESEDVTEIRPFISGSGIQQTT